MDKINTLWDLNERRGDSTVQRFGGRVVKIYSRLVEEQPLRLYHEFQGNLSDIIVSTTGTHLERSDGIKEIRLSFLDLGGVEIRTCSDIYSQEECLTTEVPYIEGSPVYDHLDSKMIMRAIYGELFATEKGSIIQKLRLTIHIHNLKIVSKKGGILCIECTDVFSCIPVQVDRLLAPKLGLLEG